MNDIIVITINLSPPAADKSCTINLSVTHLDRHGENVNRDDLFHETITTPSIESVLSNFSTFNASYNNWGGRYRYGNRIAVTPEQEHSYAQTVQGCNRSFNTFIDSLNEWLDLAIDPTTLDNIRDKLQSLKIEILPIRLAFETTFYDFQDLPWDRCTNSRLFRRLSALGEGISINTVVSRRVIASRQAWQHPLKVLIIKGNTQGLNVEKDINSIVNHLSTLETQPEIYPQQDRGLSIGELNDLLWNYSWNIIIYLGHTSTNTDGNDGSIQINSNGDVLTVEDLTNALERSIQLGLQVLIFNSCDGNGLARRIHQILLRKQRRLPFIVAMRRKIADEIANYFIERFTMHFFRDRFSIEKSIAETNKYLRTFRSQYPGADSLATLWCDTKSPYLVVPNAAAEIVDAPTKLTIGAQKTDPPPQQPNLWQRIWGWLLESV